MTKETDDGNKQKIVTNVYSVSEEHLQQTSCFVKCSPHAGSLEAKQRCLTFRSVDRRQTWYLLFFGAAPSGSACFLALAVSHTVGLTPNASMAVRVLLWKPLICDALTSILGMIRDSPRVIKNLKRFR